MGLSEIVEGSFESEDNKKWVIAGIALKAPLKPIYTIPSEKKKEQEQEVEAVECFSTTPTNVESKIPTMLTCPPAPMKRKPTLKYNYCGIVKELFTATPHDLETVFMRQVEKAN
ncbi:hypothetical protein Lal_00040039 [Lupinus albus]|uniref:Uncharacterized protein n=1 Tax=Lupinus albus TaxID=3870 RepID=A0A6A4Q2K9_LUPAL|nr:hypothetical protein Lalb_Chr09g0334821 [Lupinus albus]KAF1862774.1 hypothetical protein Lal_00040039 [Lupinus albus]